MNRAKVASNLVKMTWMRDHPALATTDLDINQIDWKTIDKFEWNRTQLVLIEILRFINCGESLMRLSEINLLSQDEKRIVALSLNMLYNDLGLEENLV
jgi:polysaccharide pyruvyl transferase WcaK-like protein